MRDVKNVEKEEARQTKTLLLTIAVPDFYAEDLTHEAAEEFYGGDWDTLVYESLGLISDTVRLLVATGDKGGNELFDVPGVIVGSEVDSRVPKYEEPEDERLTEMIKRWHKDCVREARAPSLTNEPLNPPTIQRGEVDG